MSTAIYHLAERNARAQETIASYAALHVGTDACIGMGGFLPIPGAGTASIVAAIAAGIPIYKKLAADLCVIYEGPSDANIDRRLAGGILTDGALTAAPHLVSAAGAALAEQFGKEFLWEIKDEVIKELGLGVLVSWLPVVAGFLTVGWDIAVAASMTWRVGTMISMYYQYGSRWLNDSRHATWETAKDMTGPLSPQVTDRVDLSDVPSKVPEIFEWQVDKAVEVAMSFFKSMPTASEEDFRQMLCDLEFSEEVIEAALVRIMKEVKRRTREQ